MGFEKCTPVQEFAIPVIMEERLTQIGAWLKVNGEAIYGTKPWKASRQWSAGEVPKVDYNAEFNSDYDVAKLAGKPEGGLRLDMRPNRAGTSTRAGRSHRAPRYFCDPGGAETS